MKLYKFKHPFKIMKKVYTLFLFIGLFFSCTAPQKKDSVSPHKTLKYAKGFSITQENGFQKITISNPYKNAEKKYEYLLVPKEKKVPNTNNNTQIIRTPVEKIIVTSTSHIPLLELLEKENTLVGFPNTNFISSPKTRKLVDHKQVKEIGKEEHINTEILLDLSPELVMSFAVDKPNKSFTTIQKMGIPILLNGDWLEETPLGRAEWIHVFGAIFNETKKADSIFTHIEQEYLKAKKIASHKVKTKPTILSGSIFQDVWYLPAGESFIATYFKDAQINYLWENTKGTGSLSLNFESVFEKGQHADIWIGCSMNETKEQLLNSNPHYAQFDAFKNNNVYTFAKYKGATGGMFYFELGPIRPDLLLKDIIKISHPELLPEYKTVFFSKLDK
ncbi:ABC transporter substrate-binding protein [Flavicella sp.]|uniref:ABC transporter substrate-binding protein n=1 Tax=Flavicella sp. TaxID=2957742 RepID=UPI002627E5A6|nr:ABC transporter substrate-binding protein [Flavicella sp.]MDG1803738.1 ABC transporter substrate-binding protein [Flavicella sp.]MDG2279073.1 ABC transporter substrate-binding protein [Flavicella sp.]